MSVRFLLSGVALLALTACGGGGGGGDDGRTDLFSDDASFNDLVSETVALTSYFSSTATESLPQNDTASYTGIIVLADELPTIDPSTGAPIGEVSDTGYIGRVAIGVNFGASDASFSSGTANNFYAATLDSSGNAESPSSDILSASQLSITSGSFSDPSFQFGVSGELVGEDVIGTMDGRFATDTAKAIIAREGGSGLAFGTEGATLDARMIVDDRSR